MLKKGLRLQKKEDFDRVFRFGKPLFFGEVGCRYLLDAPSIRLGFSLGKKHLPLAIDRNRFRRVFSEVFYKHQEEWPQAGDILFFLVKKPKKVDTKQTEKIMQSLFQTINKNRKA
ncbi:MAG: ribonuclease P protein component [Candidatus Moranbacteria bacterium CG_4_9_14_3_um_filter_45_14]|nr:MAG: ribonuclease P protein component [Candidatus Moranbacteria bacterium CG2_30_45_14]PJA85810.1 MAG: ribonuclease P protein component [Candidatus Moranbacteria bacterium CG_4_9_14_3_um_filter_45_14]